MAHEKSLGKPAQSESSAHYPDSDKTRREAITAEEKGIRDLIAAGGKVKWKHLL